MKPFLITKYKTGTFKFTLRAKNGFQILHSQEYFSDAACRNGIESVARHCQDDHRYERMVGNGRYWFNLKAANGQVIGTSANYSSEAARENGIESVKVHGYNTDYEYDAIQAPEPVPVQQSALSLLNQKHREAIKGMESIHTKDFPAAYTNTALDAMQEYAKREAIEFALWVMENQDYLPDEEGVAKSWEAWNAARHPRREII